MLYPSIDKILTIVPSKFLLVNIVSKRIKEMDKEGNYLLDNYKSTKMLGKALEEIYNGKIYVRDEKCKMLFLR